MPPRRPLLLALLAAAAVLAAGPAASAGKPECDRSKKYRLHSGHGPWVIMAATFHPIPGGNPDGLTAEQAADELVYELRERGIPAVAWVVESRKENLTTRGMDGSEQARVMAALRGGVCVMCGNYPSADDPRIPKNLDFIKTLTPECLSPDEKRSRGWTGVTGNGGLFRLTPGRKEGPLAKAILTPNPLLSDADRRRLARRKDPLLVRLNAGQEHTLGKCPGNYTVVIAQFRGKTLVQVAGTKSANIDQRVSLSDDLDDAAKQAWELCQVLRNRDKVEAYVWHDRHRSVVTVGSFEGPDDPALRRTARQYGAKPVPGAAGPQPQTLTVPANAPDLRKAKRYWLLEASPFPMEVPAT